MKLKIKNSTDIENIECNLIGKMWKKKDLKQENDIIKSIGIYKIIILGVPPPPTILHLHTHIHH